MKKKILGFNVYLTLKCSQFTLSANTYALSFCIQQSS